MPFPNLGGYEKDYSAMPAHHSSAWVLVKGHAFFWCHTCNVYCFLSPQLPRSLLGLDRAGRRYDDGRQLGGVHSTNHREKKDRKDDCLISTFSGGLHEWRDNGKHHQRQQHYAKSKSQALYADPWEGSTQLRWYYFSKILFLTLLETRFSLWISSFVFVPSEKNARHWR